VRIRERLAGKIAFTALPAQDARDARQVHDHRDGQPKQAFHQEEREAGQAQPFPERPLGKIDY
jgi:hypothetical protein